MTCRLGHMIVTLRLVFPGPLFPSYLSGSGHEDSSADVFGTAELPQEGQLLNWIGLPEQIYIIALRGLGNLARTRPYPPTECGKCRLSYAKISIAIAPRFLRTVRCSDRDARRVPKPLIVVFRQPSVSPRVAKKPMEMYQAGPGVLFTDKGDCPSIPGG